MTLAWNLDPGKSLTGLIQTQSPVIISNDTRGSLLMGDMASLALSPVLIDQNMVALIYAGKHNKATRPFEERDLLLIVGVSHHVSNDHPTPEV